MLEYSDEDILLGIRHGDSLVWEYIYNKWLPMIETMVKCHRGDTARARDVFQEATLILIEKVQEEDLRLSCKFSTYLYSICFKIQSQYNRSCESKTKRMDQLPDMVCEPETDTEIEKKVHVLVEKYFDQLSKSCQKILRLYVNKVSIAHISKIMNHTQVQYTMDRKYRCKRSLITRITADPNYKEIRDEYLRKDRTLY